MADTTSLSSFPNNIDTFDRVSDISEQQGTLEKSQEYKKLIDTKQYEEAGQYLRNNKDLAQCAVNASMFNKHSDAIVALEERALSDGLGFSTALSKLNNKIEQSINDLENDINNLENTTNNISNSVTTIEEKHKISLAGKWIGTIQQSNSEISYNNLYQQSFYVPNDGSFNDRYLNSAIFIPNTDWVLQDGNWNKSSHAHGKNIISIEGVIQTKSKFWYPIGYNDGKISVNATFSQYPVSPYSYTINIRYSGIDKDDILCVRGIIKYVIYTL